MSDQRPPLDPDPLTVPDMSEMWRAYLAEPRMVVVPPPRDTSPMLMTILLVALVSGAVGFILAWTFAPRVDAASRSAATAIPTVQPTAVAGGARNATSGNPSLPSEASLEDSRAPASWAPTVGQASSTVPQPPAVEPIRLPAAAPIRGVATWYCGRGSACTRGYGPADLVAAIDPTLGIHRGELLTVTAGGRSVTVRVVDVCACAGARVIDLTSGAFRRLAPLSRGTVAVTLTPGRPLPATDARP